MYSHTRTLSAKGHKSNIWVKWWHNKYEILNQIEKKKILFKELHIKSNRIALQTSKEGERTCGTPCISKTTLI